MAGVKVNCHRHVSGHIMKPSDLAVLVTFYQDKLVEMAYEPPLPEVAGVSDADALRRITCPQADLDGIKKRKDFSKKSA